MILLLIRHGLAEERSASLWPDDSLRPLTPKGRRKFVRQAAAFRTGFRRPRQGRSSERSQDGNRDEPGAGEGLVDCVLSSGFARAWETARLFSRHAGTPKPQRESSLEEEGIAAALESIRHAAASLDDEGVLAIVGHEPMLSTLASHLISPASRRGDSRLPSSCVKLRKGAILGLALGRSLRRGKATVLWLLDPRFT